MTSVPHLESAFFVFILLQVANPAAASFKPFSGSLYCCLLHERTIIFLLPGKKLSSIHFVLSSGFLPAVVALICYLLMALPRLLREGDWQSETESGGIRQGTRNILELRKQLIGEVLEDGWLIPQEDVSCNLSLLCASRNKTGARPTPSAVSSSRILLAKEAPTVACQCRWCAGWSIALPGLPWLLQGKEQESPISAVIPRGTWSPSPWDFSLAWAETHCPQSDGPNSDSHPVQSCYLTGYKWTQQIRWELSTYWQHLLETRC